MLHRRPFSPFSTPASAVFHRVFHSLWKTLWNLKCCFKYLIFNYLQPFGRGETGGRLTYQSGVCKGNPQRVKEFFWGSKRLEFVENPGGSFSGIFWRVNAINAIVSK
jgi:hypothetical protein